MRKMPKKEKKKSWKEIQRERQIKQQRVQEAHQIQREREAKRKPRKWPKGKIFVAVCLLVLILGVYGAWQYTKSSTPSDGTPVIPTSGFIYIMPDGQVTPSTAPISNAGNSNYTFTADIYDPIVIKMDNIVIDGAGRALQGIGAYGSIGIDLTGRSGVTITNMKIKDFEIGVYLSAASLNILSQNNLTNNYCGIWIEASSNDNTISGNKITNNEMYGIWLKESSRNKISENELTLHTNYTIFIRSSENNNIFANYIADNNLGIFLSEASNNILYNNSFVDNRVHAADSASTNYWDKSSIGNYWDDYLTRYSNATEVDNSGIGNTPYFIDEGNQDNYPLMKSLSSGLNFSPICIRRE
jgi:parallel beta-helix repeat protein